MSLGRLTAIFFSLGVGLMVLHWAAMHYGRWVGLIAFGILDFEPNLFARSRPITTDLYATSTISPALLPS